MEFDYECGTFESSSEKIVSFVRVANISDVITKTVAQLNESGLLVRKNNIPENVLLVLLSGDKGGKSTKLLLQFLNCKEQHSVHTARLQPGYWQFSKGTKTITNVLKRFSAQSLMRHKKSWLMCQNLT